MVRHEGRPGVVSALDRARLVRAATAAGAVIEVRFGIGGYVPTGADLFAIRGAAQGVDRAELRKGVILAEERTITQDPAFALRAIVDIALRALSPAVNDPTTAVQALDGIDALLMEFAARDLERGRITGEDGALRLVYPNMVWADVLDLSLTEIRHYGVDTPQIARRLRALLLGLAEQAPRRGAPRSTTISRASTSPCARPIPTRWSARTPRPRTTSASAAATTEAVGRAREFSCARRHDRALPGAAMTTSSAAVVCLHGLRRTSADWDAVCRGLPEGRRRPSCPAVALQPLGRTAAQRITGAPAVARRRSPAAPRRRCRSARHRRTGARRASLPRAR